MKRRLIPFSFNRFYALLVLVALVPASLGYMYHEGSSTTITQLEIDGAPGGIVFIADPHLRDANLAHVEEIIDQVNALHPSLVLIGGDFTTGEKRICPSTGYGRRSMPRCMPSSGTMITWQASADPASWRRCSSCSRRT